MTDTFCHLHQHTEFSLLDGAAKVKEGVKKAAADGQPAMGITDHGNMYGVPDFYKACTDEGVKPIIGTEAYMALNSRDERPKRRSKKVDDFGGDTDQGQKLYYHVTLLAENNQGYQNLIKIASRAFLEGYYYKPRTDWDMLADHHEGVIATSGCLGGQVLQALLNDDYEEAKRRAGRFQDIFGRDNFFIEIQDHGIGAQHQTNPYLFQIAEEINAPLLLTNDSHYVNRDDHIAHDALLCVQTGSKLTDPDRFKFEGEEHYIKTAAEMRRLFPDHKSASDNTLWIAERANVELDFSGKTLHLPTFPFPDRYETDSDYLQALVLGGAKKRYGKELPERVSDRLAYELKVIKDMGFSSYFLIVWDLIRHARGEGIRIGPARGSAGGCAVAYCLGITEIDPIKYDLLFERFLNPSRVSMPDIDFDIDTRYRGNLINYAAQKYGKDHVSQIITFTSIKGRSSIRGAARVLDYPYAVGDKIAKAMPPLVMGRDTPLHACLKKEEKHEDGYERASEIRQMYSSDPDSKKVIDVAVGLEDLKQSDGIHAAAVVISPGPLTDYVPIQRKPERGKDPEEAPIVTQYEMGAVEDLGLLKMDFLGLRNLDVIEDTLRLIKEYENEEIDIYNIPMDDEATFQLLREARSIGVFQLEGNQMRDLMRSLAPTEFDDICALVALYRPGPMAANMHNDYANRKNGRRPVTFDHEDLKPILEDTYGLMVYQEELMRAAQKLAGYSLAEADNLRKACGKKKRDLIEKEREKFIPAVVANGYSEEFAKQQFDLIEPFADYAFNKSHAYGYGLISYQTAYLKANYPVYFMAALLTSAGSQGRLRVFLNECRHMGIRVQTPDVNVSYAEFKPIGDEISFGMASMRNLGTPWAEAVSAEREANGEFTSFQDFAQRMKSDWLNSKFLESAILGGAFDSIEPTRKGLLGVSKKIVTAMTKRKKVEDAGQGSLFDSIDGGVEADVIKVPDIEFEYFERLTKEKEMLGVFVSDNPLLAFEGALKEATDASILDIVESEDGANHTIGGLVTSLRKITTKKGDMMAIMMVEDLEGEVEVIVFPKTYKSCGAILNEDTVVLVDGRYATERREDANFIANSVSLLSDFKTADDTYVVKVPENASQASLSELKKIFAENPGSTPVILEMADKKHDVKQKVTPGLKLDVAIAQLWRS